MVESIRNFRDMGDIKVSGGTIKSHKLLRGGVLDNLSSSTLEKLLGEYRLQTVVDLRTDEEIKKTPDDTIPGVESIHIDIMSKARENADPNEMMKGFKREVSQEHMRGLNRMFIMSDDCRDEYRKFFDVILEEREGSLYYHCTAGKDRTGFAAVQILKILGASDEVIYDDYLLTNTLTHEYVENRLKEIQIIENLTDAQISNIRGYMIVDQAYLDEAFLAIDERYGSFDNYISEGLGLSKEDIEKLHNLYVNTED
ncbi:MAG: tyrosine-protein phosphatase [Erysipelothrix sp.]